MTIERASNLYFLRAKERWESITPIRGRYEDIRPLGDRRKDTQRVVKIDEDTYAYRHHNTDVVTFHADGRIVVDSGGYITKTTREFLHIYSPFIVSRADNMYWVRPYSSSKSYPVSGTTPVTLREYSTGWVADARDIRQRVLNREKIKQLRKDIKGFTQSTEELIKITDGWFSSETFREHSKLNKTGEPTRVNQRYFDFEFEKPIVENVLKLYWVVNPLHKQSLANMLEIMTHGSDTERTRLALAIIHYSDVRAGLVEVNRDNGNYSWRIRVDVKFFRDWVSTFLRLLDVYDLVPVEDGCYARNLVV